MGTKLENQLLQKILESSKYYIPENTYFLGQRYMELNKDENLHKIIPIFLHLKKFHFLISILKHKKNKISRYYYSLALFFTNKLEASKKILLSFLNEDNILKNSQKKNLKSCSNIKKICLPFEFIFYYLGRIFEKQKRDKEAQKFYFKSYEENNSLFCSFERYMKSVNKTDFIDFGKEKKNFDFLFTKNNNDNNLVNQNLSDNNISSLFNSEFKLFREKINDTNNRIEPFVILNNKIDKEKNLEFSNFLKNYITPYKQQLNSKYEKAYKNYLKIPKIYQKSSFFLNNIGICLMKMVKYKAAYEFFKKARKHNKTQLEGVEYFSTCLWHLNKTNDLIELSEILFKNFPENFKTWLVLGNSYSVLKDHSSAIKYFKRGIQINKNSSYGYCLLGHEFIFLEDYDLAKKSYFSAIEINNLEFTGYWGLGNVFLKTDNFNQALKYFLIALSLNPNCATIYTYIGITLINQEKFDLALKIFEKSQKLDQDSLMNNFYKATALYNLKLYDEAIVELEKLKTTATHEPRIYLLMGKIFKELGLIDRAHENFLLALNFDPKDSQKKIRNLIDCLNAEEGVNDKENFKTPNSYQF